MKKFVTAASYNHGTAVRYHGNRKSEKGATYRVVRKAGSVTLQSVRTGRLRALTPATRLMPA
jgi:hypothetical protein